MWGGKKKMNSVDAKILKAKACKALFKKKILKPGSELSGISGCAERSVFKTNSLVGGFSAAVYSNPS